MNCESFRTFIKGQTSFLVCSFMPRSVSQVTSVTPLLVSLLFYLFDVHYFSDGRGSDEKKKGNHIPGAPRHSN